ncbi:MAG: hypothetical protein ACHQ7N_18500 [Candidatus Methylomirabilales bacterium]
MSSVLLSLGTDRITELLGEDKFTDLTHETLEDLHYAITAGHCSSQWEILSTTELTPQEMATALVAQASDPGFFGLDEHGNTIDEN